MTLSQAVKTCLTTKYADFKGRATRSEFWWFILFYYVAILALIFLYVIATEIHTGVDVLGNVLFSLIMIVMAAMMLPILSVMVRRLHDVGKSGWFLFINLIPWIGGLIFFVYLLLPSKEHGKKQSKTEQTIIDKPAMPIEETIVEEQHNNLSIFTLPLILGLAILFAPFSFWLMRFPSDLIVGEGSVGAVLLLAGVLLAIWKKLSLPKDKWLCIATVCIMILVLTVVICRLVGYSNMYLPLSLFLFCPLWLVYFGIRFWQANKK